jgi:RNA polymerase sigma-70 factor, ECF subfamily
MSLAECERQAENAVCEQRQLVEELTRGLVRADEAAYQAFFAQYARRIFLYALALTRGEEESAKELLQLTMIRVTKYIRVFEREEEFWSWLTRLTRSCWIDEHRKKSRYRQMLDFFRGQRTEDDPGTKGSEALLPDLIERLEPADRELLEDKYLEGRSVREIAMRLESSEKAVESKLTRAREKLRRLMAK